MNSQNLSLMILVTRISIQKMCIRQFQSNYNRFFLSDIKKIGTWKGRLVLEGVIGVSRGGWSEQGRLVSAGEIGVSMGGWC